MSKSLNINKIEIQKELYKKNKFNRKVKVLFFHNTLPEYRIGWFKELSIISDCEFVITNERLNKKEYGFDIDYERAKGLNCIFLAKGKGGILQLLSILKNIAKYDFVELPAIDSVREVICGKMIVDACKKNRVKVGYFWEKWEAPKNKQPIVRRIKNLLLRIVPKMIYKKADIIFAPGIKSKEYFISNGVDEKKISVIPNVSETPPSFFEDIRIKYGIPIGKRIIMYLGRLMPQKGIQCLIRAYQMLEKGEQEQCYLLIAGDGEDREQCEKLASDLKIVNIVFAGSVDPRIRSNYFEQCDVFVYPVSYYSGWVDVWGLTLNEAIQHGKIIIGTDAVGSAYELIEDGVNGFRVEPDNPKALCGALSKSLDHMIASTAEIKDKQLMQTFNVKNMAREYLKFVDQELEKK